MEVVAEGIETMEQMNYLKKYQCKIGQGYLISKPLAADEMEAFLNSNDKKQKVHGDGSLASLGSKADPLNKHDI